MARKEIKILGEDLQYSRGYDVSEYGESTWTNFYTKGGDVPELK